MPFKKKMQQQHFFFNSVNMNGTKKIKCVLEAHYRIPPPVLMILMGNLPQVSSSIEDITDESLDESQIIKVPKEDGWNKVGLDEVDEVRIYIPCIKTRTLNNFFIINIRSQFLQQQIL